MDKDNQEKSPVAQVKENKEKKPVEHIYAQSLSPQNIDETQAAPPMLWLITFTDVMALMLTFFVLLYSMSVPDAKQWSKMTSTLHEGLSTFKGERLNAGPQELRIDKLDFQSALNVNYLKALLAELIKQEEALKDITLFAQDRKVTLSFPHDILFRSGEAVVSPQGKKTLFALSALFSRIGNRIEVIGHADPRPISDQNKNFDSNWHLSLARASSVGAILDDVGYTRPIIVRGMSSARYDELSEDLDEEGRLSLSRRVDIVIMRDNGSQHLLLNLGL